MTEELKATILRKFVILRLQNSSMFRISNGFNLHRTIFEEVLFKTSTYLRWTLFSYWNQLIDLLSESFDWFLCGGIIDSEWVKTPDWLTLPVAIPYNERKLT